MKAFIRLTVFSLVFVTLIGVSAADSFAQERDRVIPSEQNRRNNQRRLTNEIEVKKKPAIKKTADTKPVEEESAAASSYMSATRRAMMMTSIRSKLGIRYKYGSQGPYTYDCSGFVWKVFNEAGIPLTRTSARVYYNSYPAARGDERYEFGTLVFFNRLGHMGIVVDENGFYHASSSKGVTYSKFAGYWSKRIVGFRKVPLPKPLVLPKAGEEDTYDDDIEAPRNIRLIQ